MEASVGRTRQRPHFDLSLRQVYNGSMKNLLPETRRILAEVEDVSGREIQFLEDATSPLIASLRIARDGAAFHVLRYLPSSQPLDYFVVYQAAFLLRLYAMAPGDRFDFVATGLASDTVESLVALGRQLPESDRRAIPEFASSVSNWALMNLRSLPIGMRIDKWIHDSFPSIRAMQANGIGTMQQQNANILSYRHGTLTVPVSLIAPNAAYALFCDRLLTDSAYAVPYKAAGAIEGGQRLLAIWDALPEEPANDKNLVDAWAGEVGIRDWYKWIPFRP